jgi:hypothetical protein
MSTTPNPVQEDDPVTLSDISQTQEVADSIVTAEKDRIAKEQTGLDSETYTRDRAVYASQSYSRRMSQYAYLTGVIVGALVISAILAFARSFLPTFLCDIGIAVVMVGGFIWAYYIYLDIIGRDLADFDKISPNKLINSDKLLQPSTAADIAEGKTGGDKKITSPKSACSGSECCDEKEGTKWDATKLKCLPIPASASASPSSAFTTMDMAYSPSSLILPQTGILTRVY